MANVRLHFLSILVFVMLCSSIGLNPRLTTTDEVEERECIGTANLFSGYGNYQLQYDSLRKRYTGCTYVWGNLEITHLDSRINYDLSFLRHIRYVTGYVLIALTTHVTEIPLLSLEIIRGNDTASFGGQEYSLLVSLTSSEYTVFNITTIHGLRTLMMPNLKEILSGKVMFMENPALGFVNTVDWAPIMRGRVDDVKFGTNAYNESAINGTDLNLCNGGKMWGNDVALCQKVDQPQVCHEDCDGICYGVESDQCCDDTCAIGCRGPGPENCTRCKDFEYYNKCVSHCPALTYQLMQDCVDYTPLTQ